MIREAKVKIRKHNEINALQSSRLFGLWLFGNFFELSFEQGRRAVCGCAPGKMKMLRPFACFLRHRGGGRGGGGANEKFVQICAPPRVHISASLPKKCAIFAPLFNLRPWRPPLAPCPRYGPGFEYLLIKLTSIEMWYWIQSEQCLSIIHTISNPIICFIYFFLVIFKFIQLTVIIFYFNFFIDKYNNSKHCFVVFQYIQLNILMKNEQNEFSS